jgi:uncharacterized phage protein (TIGR02218 family)
MPTQNFIDKETGFQRKPVELYHAWRGDDNWYYTSHDQAVTYGGNEYTPITIKRSKIQHDTETDASKVTVTFAKVNPAIVDYLTVAPLDLAWISISKLFRDQDPYETYILFTGQLIYITLKGIQAQAECRGIEYLLHQPILRYIYQPECNWTLFDDGCGLAAATYKVTTGVTLDSTETILTSSDFGLQSNGYWMLGYVEFDGEKRFIVDHDGDDITIQYPFSDLNDFDDVDAYPGCNGAMETCRDKFSNTDSFFGFPYVPIDNPTVWIDR